MSAKLRVFGVANCEKCKSLIAHLDVMGLQYDYVDADADEAQELCDEHGVYLLPHVQVIANEKVQYEAAAEAVNVPELLIFVKTAGH